MAPELAHACIESIDPLDKPRQRKPMARGSLAVCAHLEPHPRIFEQRFNAVGELVDVCGIR
jgi:hypothetical protein